MSSPECICGARPLPQHKLGCPQRVKLVSRSLSQNRRLLAQGAAFEPFKDPRRNDPHIVHCCVQHGCKYGEKDCPVTTGQINQLHACEYCADEAQEPHLFTDGKFTSHAGLELLWKINCDALTDADMACLAKQVTLKLFSFKAVQSIPRGGDRFAKALWPYCNSLGIWDLLIVDDVWTTGASMRQAYTEALSRDADSNIHGLVIFARGVPSWWVTPIFTLGGIFC